MKNKRKVMMRRILAFMLTILLVFSEESVVSLAMGATVSGGDAVIAESTVSGGDAEATDTTVSAGDSVDTEAEVTVTPQPTEVPEPTDVPQPTEVPEAEELLSRAPEKFYEEPAAENYGALVAYDEYSRTYQVKENEFVTVIGNDATSYIDYDGSLQRVDNTLVEMQPMSFAAFGAEQPSQYMNSANSFAVSLASDIEEGEELFCIMNDDYMISFVPVGGSFHDAVAKENAIRYSNVFENVDFQYTVIKDTVKEDIILLEKQEMTAFSYKVLTYGLKTAVINNALYLYEEGTDPETMSVFVLEAPEMEDAVGELSFGVRLDVEEVADGCIVTVTADEEWLNAPERIYPVRIDPTAIQVPSSAIHIACAEEGSPNVVIGDNSYPYVGYDDGIKSGNLKGFGVRHKNCRSYFQIDYDFAALSEEAEIVSAAFQVTQKTGWSKGNSEFGLFGVEEAWTPGRLNWNTQIDYNHYFIDSQNSVSRNESMMFDVTEEVIAWINGTTANNGFVMKALTEAPNEEAAAAGVAMQCEVLYNNASAAYAPKLILSWEGKINGLDTLTLDDTTVDVYPVVERNGDKSSNTLGVVAHGLAAPGSTVTYSLVNGTTGSVEAETELVYPNSALYKGAFSTVLDVKRELSNWQSEVFSNLAVGQVYYVTATASKAGKTGATAVSDTFLIYEEGAFDLIPRVASHYGVALDTIMSDMKMQDCLTRDGNRIFIRNPQNASEYSSGELSNYYKATIDGLLMGRAQNCEYGFEPININTGNFYMEQEDAGLSDIGGSFSINRQYNSKGAGFKGSFGYGWSFAYDERLGELRDGSVIWLGGDGSIVTFTKTEGGFAAPAGYAYTLAERESGYCITALSTGISKEFDVYGLLTAIVDVNGNRTELSYDDEYRLSKVTSPSGKTYTFTLDEEKRVSNILLPDGNSIAYAYNAAGQLVSVTNPLGGVIRYEYTEAHLMTAWYDENGHRVIANEYDGEGRVVKQTDAENAVVTLAYSQNADGGQTIATDALGNVTVYTYDAAYRTTGIQYPDKSSVTKAYNAQGYLSAETDVLGVKYEYTYDNNGNLLKTVRQDGAVKTYTYNDRNQVTSVTDYDGGCTSYAYDAAYRLQSVTDACGNQTTYTYDSLNRVVAVTDACKGVTSYEYAGACVSQMTDACGNVWKYTYDPMNRPLTTTDPKGNVSKKTYDAIGRVIKETDETGSETLYTFDAAGAVIAITDKEGNTSNFVYDRMNRMTEAKDPLGNTLTYTYDANGNTLTEIDAEGNVISYAYDSRNRVTEETDANGNRTLYTYDAAGNIVSETDRRGNTLWKTYDALTGAAASITDAEGYTTTIRSDVMGRTMEITYADGSSISYEYDKLSRPTYMTNEIGTVTEMTYDGMGNVTVLKEGEYTYRYEYDALGRLKVTTDPLGNKTTYTYDELGNVLSVTDANGNKTDYSYDALSRIAKLTDAMGGVTGYAYDKEGRVTDIIAPEGDKTHYTYNAIGELIKTTDALGNESTYTYDGISRLLGSTDALGGTIKYIYDADGNIKAVTDENGNVHLYETDAEGNLLKDTYPNYETETYLYDKNGNVISYTDRKGIETTLAYDARGRVTKASDTAGNGMSYTYDASGNLLTQTDVLGRTITYVYDAYSRPVKMTDVDGAITTYAYDALGRVTKVTDAAGNITSYTYDAAGNLLSGTEPGEAVTTYTYDALNRLAQKTDPEGAVTTFAYDGNNNLTEKTDGNGVTTAFTYDALNRPVIYTDGNGGTTGYAYDALSRLISITTPEGISEQYAYDPVGNMVSVTDGMGNSTSYSYDKLYRLVKSLSPMGAENTYEYDSHDNVVKVTDALGVSEIYEYNDNRQVVKYVQANGGTYQYTYDAVQRLTAVKTPLGYETLLTYSIGDDVIAEADNLDRVTTYSYDVLHNLTRVTDAEGGETTYSYDARGNQTSVTNALGYTYSYAYDKVNRMITVEDPEEKAAQLLYDGEGNVIGVSLPGGRSIAYTYDNNYNTIAITDPKGYRYSYTYDRDDRLVGTADPLSQKTLYTYDKVNRMTSATDKLGLVESYTYDVAGNLTALTDGAGLTTNYAYDLKGRMTSVTDHMGSTAYYTYDEMDNLTAVTDYMGRGTAYTYDLEGNLTSITDAGGRREVMTYDMAGRVTSYTSNGGNTIRYDYDRLNNLVEKAYTDASGAESAAPVMYAYDAAGQRVAMYDSTGDTEYTYDGLGRITSVTTYRSETGEGDVIGYTYNEADKLSAITYPDGTKVSYEYDLNNNLIKVTDREGLETTYVYDAINRITEIHRPNGISTYNTYNANDQITVLENKCDDCDWVVSSYSYTYDERGFITGETAIESLAGYAYDDKHNGKHTDGKHDDLYPHGTKHAKHDKDATFAYQIVQTDRSFVYDDAGKLISATETEDNYGTYTYTYEYDLMGNRTSMTRTASDGTVAEWHKYVYNDSNQLVSEELYNGKKTTSLSYTYDADGNRIIETGKIGTDKVEKTYTYTVENRLEAVYDGKELLMAAAYDGDGNRVFQLNYNLHTDEDWKGNSGNGNGSNKDNKGNNNNGKGNSKKNGNSTNAETNNSQNQSGILFPVEGEVSSTEEYLISLISSTGKQKNYELIEYVNDVNREYTEVLVEQNINGKTDTAYIYGTDRLSLDRFDGSTGYYLYDPRGSVAGITNEEGQIYQSYRYSVNGEITFGAPQYENEYTYNAESYNPNIQSQYLRARYYNVVSASFLTEDSYLGELMEPLTLNRYNYCSSNPVNYCDPSGQFWDVFIDVVSVVFDIVELVKEPSWENAGTLLADVALAVVPFAPAVTGTAVRTGKKVVNVAADAMSAADKMADAKKTIEGVTEVAEIVDDISDTAKVIESATETAEIVDDISDTAKALENTADAGSKLPVPGPDDFADDLMKSNAKSGDNYLIKNSEEALENAKTNLCKTADNLDAKGVGNVVDGGGVPSGYYQDANGKWHRPNGQFASNAEVGITSPTKTPVGSHGNSLSDPRTNYGYVLVDKDTNDILKFGETLYPETRYTKSYLEQNNAVMKVLESGSKEYIHYWQYDMNKYYKYMYEEFPPLLNSEGW